MASPIRFLGYASGAMIRRIVVFSVFLWISNLSQAQAELITYTESAVASGTIGNQVFSGELVTLTLTADTSGITFSGGIFYTSAAMATVSIAGIGNASFTDNLVVFNYPGVEAGFEDFTPVVGDALIMAIVNASLSTYDLASAIGPLTGPTSGGGGSFATTLGTLYLNPPFDSGTFTATTPIGPRTYFDRDARCRHPHPHRFSTEAKMITEYNMNH